MSVTLEGNSGCSALGHLYRADAQRRVCITCGHVEAPPATETDSLETDSPETDSPESDS
ncbi:MAG: hypothetical protein NWS32_07735 [Candidatus Nanopelagicales bacterium]|nr:hypothetical protein [Candidatus Nanopelagicales bacterium]